MAFFDPLFDVAVLDSTDSTVWLSGTAGRGVEPRHLALQDDGNLVLFDANNVTLWQTKSKRRQ